MSANNDGNAAINGLKIQQQRNKCQSNGMPSTKVTIIFNLFDGCSCLGVQ